MKTAPAPLFRDPIFDGPTDPTVIYNREENAWWIVYTQRRATQPSHSVDWVHGTDLGVASSRDGGQTWLYRGTLNLQSIEPGRNTFWAPEILHQAGLYHMYVSYITGVPDNWNWPRHILHYTSSDLWNWRYESALDCCGHKAIDACVYPLPQGGFRLWYKDESDGSHTHFADSPDLYHWSHGGVAADDCGQEGPNVFRLGGQYWMIADCWRGMAVYHGEDLTHWMRQPGFLLGEAGARREDTSRGHHADVLEVDEEHAYLFYFTHPAIDVQGASQENLPPAALHRSCVQVAALRVLKGRLTVIRDEPFPFELSL